MSGSSQRPLPPSLDPQTAYLVGVLRQLKDRSGLSLTSLAARTPYSRSSWDRFLNGRKLPPREAVEMLGRLAKEPVERLVALWEQAEEQTSGRNAEAVACTGTPKSTGRQAGTEPSSASGPVVRFVAARWFRLGVVVAAIVCAVAWTYVQAFGPRVQTAPSGRTGPFEPAPLTVGCRGVSCKGREAGAMACDVDAASYTDLKIGLTHVELVVSRNCAAAWARISYSSVGDRVKVQDRAGPVETATVVDQGSTDTYVVTPMLPAPSLTRIRACWEPRSAGPHCTTWGPATP
ncbi:helix-turn-helix domain-containing protein [Streptomyces colonosanans]|uniref:HTH cro/C1-type domain-containing protein n=1 Tax=Streptomyces colonosanans TaxID=1428652 RepID=A0A1S2NVP3_9ACTN|nr:XRE family transcriptional regulator [Streptomyces colonosanans]OIJ85226.1 hypothetical protein BIV24_29110 [Streptomyces colonosanans]